jgi:hypothetical protein
MLETISIGNNIHHPCGQVRENGFQRITGIHKNKQAERGKNNKTTTYDLSTAQKVSSSTRPPRNIYHMRRVLAITAW